MVIEEGAAKGGFGALPSGDRILLGSQLLAPFGIRLLDLGNSDRLGQQAIGANQTDFNGGTRSGILSLCHTCQQIASRENTQREA